MESQLETLCRSLLSLAEQADAELTGPDQSLWLERLDTEHDNFRKALEACKAEPELGLRLCAALARFWWMRGHAVEGLQWIEYFKDRATGEPGLRARLLEGGGALAYARTDYAAARQWCEQALDLYRQQGDQRGEARMLNQLGMSAREQGEVETARSLHQASLERYRALDDLWGQASCHNNLGVVALLANDQAAALSHHQASLDQRRQLGDARGVASSLSNLGHLARLAGDRDEARACYQESLEIRQLLGDRWGMAALFVCQGVMACEEGDLERARGRLEQGVTMLRMVGDWLGICEALEGFSLLAEAEGAAERAVQLSAAVEGIRKALQAPLPHWKRAPWQELQARLRKMVKEDEYQEAWRVGSGLVPEEAVQLSLSR